MTDSGGGHPGACHSRARDFITLFMAPAARCYVAACHHDHATRVGSSHGNQRSQRDPGESHHLRATARKWRSSIRSFKRRSNVTTRRPWRGSGTQSVRVHGDTAVVTARLRIKGTMTGKDFERLLWFTDVYVRTPSGGAIFLGQASLALPASRRTAGSRTDQAVAAGCGNGRFRFPSLRLEPAIAAASAGRPARSGWIVLHTSGKPEQ